MYEQKRWKEKKRGRTSGGMEMHHTHTNIEVKNVPNMACAGAVVKLCAQRCFEIIFIITSFSRANKCHASSCWMHENEIEAAKKETMLNLHKIALSTLTHRGRFVKAWATLKDELKQLSVRNANMSFSLKTWKNKSDKLNETFFARWNVFVVH